MTAYNSTVFR